MTFVGDLSFGKRWEATAMRLVGGGTPAPEGRFKPYDFVRTDGKKVEVKADRLAYKYGGNTMFVEFECSGQPSGIATTEADEWMYFMVNPDGSAKWFSIPVAELKEWCVGCPVKKGGDGYRARGYIVPVRGSYSILTRGEADSGLRIQLPPPGPLTPRTESGSSGSRTGSPHLPPVLTG